MRKKLVLTCLCWYWLIFPTQSKPHQESKASSFRQMDTIFNFTLILISPTTPPTAFACSKLRHLLVHPQHPLQSPMICMLHPSNKFHTRRAFLSVFPFIVSTVLTPIISSIISVSLQFCSTSLGISSVQISIGQSRRFGPWAKVWASLIYTFSWNYSPIICSTISL